MNYEDVYNYIKEDMGTLLDPLQRSVMLYEVEQMRQRILSELNADVQPFIHGACEAFNTTFKTIDTYSRDPKLVLPRQFIMWAMHAGVVSNSLTLEAIGALFPNASRNGDAMHHSTAVHAYRTVKNLLDTDEQLRQQVTPLLNRFGWQCEYLPTSKCFDMYRMDATEMETRTDAA